MQREPRFLGVPSKTGIERFSLRDWQTIRSFVEGGSWMNTEPVLESDRLDPLLAENLPYGHFMLGFDFHLTENGPKLIEINTNAGGLATVFEIATSSRDRIELASRFVDALLREYRAFELKTSRTRCSLSSPSSPNDCSSMADGSVVGVGNHLPTVVIVDDNVAKQKMYPEMLEFARILDAANIRTYVASPEDLVLRDDAMYLVRSSTDGEVPEQIRVDFLYNRITDFRLEEASHQHLREAAIKGLVCLSPHPAAYVRYADKRNLLRIADPIVPTSLLYGERAADHWVKTKKQWVFKPSVGNGSRGVYRGDKLSVTRLRELPSDTIAQEWAPPSVSSDGTKYDIRVFTCGTEILGLASRHFSGQVMEMSSEKSGFKVALPEGFCCFSLLMSSSSCDTHEHASSNNERCECGPSEATAAAASASAAACSAPTSCAASSSPSSCGASLVYASTSQGHRCHHD